MQRPKPSVVDEPPRFAKPWLEAEIFMDREPDPGGIRAVDKLPGFVEIRSEGFLTDDVHRPIGTQRDKRPMGRRRGDDVDQIWPRLIEHPCRIVECGGRGMMGIAGGFGLGEVAIAYSDNLDARHSRPRIVMKGREIAATDDGDSDGHFLPRSGVH